MLKSLNRRTHICMCDSLPERSRQVTPTLKCKEWWVCWLTKNNNCLKTPLKQPQLACNWNCSGQKLFWSYRNLDLPMWPRQNGLMVQQNSLARKWDMTVLPDGVLIYKIRASIYVCFLSHIIVNLIFLIIYLWALE